MRKFSVIPMKAALAIAMLLMTGNSLAQDNSVYVPRNSVSLIYNNQTDKAYQRNYIYNDSKVESVRSDSPSASVQLHSNALYFLALCPNIGMEIQTDLGLAFQLDYVGAWWSNNTKHRFWQNYGFQTEMRYYLESKSKDMPYNGHHVGIYGQMATYDFEFGGTGYQCNTLDKSWGIGIAYGYRKPLSRHFSVDFTLGLGYFKSKYTVYEPNNDWYKATNWKKLNWFGPTRLEISFIWNINNKNVIR